MLYDRDGDGFLDPEEIGRLAHGSSAAMRALLNSVRPDNSTVRMSPEEKEKAEKVCFLFPYLLHFSIHSGCLCLTSHHAEPGAEDLKGCR